MPDPWNTTYKNIVDKVPPYSTSEEDIDEAKVDRNFWKTSTKTIDPVATGSIIYVSWDAVFDGPKFPNPNRPGKYRCHLTKIIERSDEPDRIVEPGEGRWRDYRPLDLSGRSFGRAAAAAARSAYRTWVEGRSAGSSPRRLGGGGRGL